MARPELRLVSSSTPSPPTAGAEIEDLSDFTRLFRRFAPYVAQIGSRILGRDDIEDLVQEVFFDAHRGLGDLRDPGAIRGWLATVTVRHATRRLRRRRLLSFVGLEAPVDAASLTDPGASADVRAWVSAVYRVLDSVSPEARVAWVMRVVEDEPLERVAEICKVSRATAHRRLQEAQAALEEAFDHA